jgi:hypothetical protein
VGNRLKVRMVKTGFETHAVDTPNDLIHVEQPIAEDRLLKFYERI